MRWLMVLCLAVVGSLAAQNGSDRVGVERAAMDYLEGFYEGSPEKLRRSVHPEVLKFGFAWDEDRYRRVPMSFQEMLTFAERVRDQGRQPGPDAPKRVEVLDVLDQTAVAKVHAWWGSDYLTMARYDGEWKIVQVLWQSPPRS
ncbi:MAG TPA: nuclear transport factor 2 family protein [Longimicrobiales bacterium]|nr:nuclear transport factor 2 family protein [Longimicrobiales bacterium]